jgi:hypothetical protein
MSQWLRWEVQECKTERGLLMSVINLTAKKKNLTV